MKRLYFVSEIEVACRVFAATIMVPKGSTTADELIDEALGSAARIIRDGLAEIEAEHARGKEP